MTIPTEPSTQPFVRGKHAGSPVALAFAAEVRRIHGRYAEEVVDAYKLCPFLRDPETAFGRFYVVLDDEVDVEAARDAALEPGAAVVHLVYPLLGAVEPMAFERLASRVGAALKDAVPRPAPVIAAFHPRLGGEPTSPGKLVGVLRRAPDPFVQVVPEGLHVGGTVLAGFGQPVEDPARKNFEKLRHGGIDEVLARIGDIHRDRDRSYAPFLALLLESHFDESVRMSGEAKRESGETGE